MVLNCRQSKLIICVLLAVAAFAFAEGQKSSVYLDATVGAAYSSFLSKGDGFYLQPDLEGHEIRIDEPRTRFYGYGPAVDVKVGGAGEFFALYFDMQLMYASGTLEQNEYGLVKRGYTETDESAKRFMLGMGFTAFPFKNPESLMHGSFVGLTLGIMAVSSDFDEQGVGVSLEFGKLWTLNKRWSVGVACIGTSDAPIRFGEDIPGYYFYTVWFGVKLVRR